MRAKDEAAETLRAINNVCYIILVTLCVIGGLISGIKLGSISSDKGFNFIVMLREFIVYGLYIFALWIAKLLADCFFNVVSYLASINACVTNLPPEKKVRKKTTFGRIVDSFSPETESEGVRSEKLKYKELLKNGLINKNEAKIINKKL